jgi:hypothetical protein
VKRHQFKRPGWDCINAPCGKRGCGTNPNANHGIHCEEWYYAVISDECDVATSLTMTTKFYPPTTDEWRTQNANPRAFDLTTHVNFHIARESVRDDSGWQDCSLVKGDRCQIFHTTSIGAEPFNQYLDFDHYEQSEMFWMKLEELHEERVAKARAARVDTKYERCQTCDGLGTVEKKS